MSFFPALLAPLGGGGESHSPLVDLYYWQGLASNASIPAPTDGGWTLTTRFNDSGGTDPDGHTTYELQTVSGIGTHGVVFGMYDHGHAHSATSANLKGFYGPGAIVSLSYWDGSAWVEISSLSAPLVGEQWNDEAPTFTKTRARYWVYKVYNQGDGTLTENRIGNFTMGLVA